MAQFTLLENLIINDEVVQLRSGSYEEVTNCSDQRTVLFKFEKKLCLNGSPSRFHQN